MNKRPQNKDGSPNEYYWQDYVYRNDLGVEDILDKIWNLERRLETIGKNYPDDKKREQLLEDLKFEISSLKLVLKNKDNNGK